MICGPAVFLGLFAGPWPLIGLLLFQVALPAAVGRPRPARMPGGDGGVQGRRVVMVIGWAVQPVMPPT